MTRRIGMLMLRGGCGAAAWGAWPGSPVSHGAAIQGGIIITLALLAGLPLLARLWLGPPDSRAARWLRASFFAAILALLPIQAAIELFVGTVPRSGINRHTFDIAIGSGIPGSSSGGPDWGGEIAILIFTACYLAAVLALTARRTPVAPATLVIAAGAGLVLGIVMYAVAPAGLNFRYPYRPGLHGSAAEAFVVLAWILVFSAPTIAGAIAGRRCHVPDDPVEATAARAWQGFGAGVVCRRCRRPGRHRSRQRHDRAAGQVGLGAGLVLPRAARDRLSRLRPRTLRQPERPGLPPPCRWLPDHRTHHGRCSERESPARPPRLPDDGGRQADAGELTPVC